jgi:hypothetical protein
LRVAAGSWFVPSVPGASARVTVCRGPRGPRARGRDQRRRVTGRAGANLCGARAPAELVDTRDGLLTAVAPDSCRAAWIRAVLQEFWLSG